MKGVLARLLKVYCGIIKITKDNGGELHMIAMTCV